MSSKKIGYRRSPLFRIGRLLGVLSEKFNALAWRWEKFRGRTIFEAPVASKDRPKPVRVAIEVPKEIPAIGRVVSPKVVNLDDYRKYKLKPAVDAEKEASVKWIGEYLDYYDKNIKPLDETGPIA